MGLGKALASIGHGPIAMAKAHSFGKAAALAGNTASAVVYSNSFLPTPHPLANGSIWEGVGLVLLNHFLVCATKPAASLTYCLVSISLCPLAALP